MNTAILRRILVRWLVVLSQARLTRSLVERADFGRQCAVAVVAVTSLVLLVSCLPGYSHPAPAHLVGLRLVNDHTQVAVLELCDGQFVSSFWVETVDRRLSWRIRPIDGAPSQRPDELRFFEAPAQWNEASSTLDEIRAGQVYVAVLAAGVSGPDVQSVKFRLADLQALGNDQVWSADLTVDGIEARIMSGEEFAARARDECRAHAERQVG